MGHHRISANIIPKCANCMYLYKNLGHVKNVSVTTIESKCSLKYSSNMSLNNKLHCNKYKGNLIKTTSNKFCINKCIKFNEDIDDCRRDHSKCGPSGKYFEITLDLGPVI